MTSDSGNRSPFTLLGQHLALESQEDWLRIARSQPSPARKLRMLNELRNAGFDAQAFHRKAVSVLIESLREENLQLRQQVSPGEGP